MCYVRFAASRCLLYVVCCMMIVVCCLLFVVCCSVCGVCGVSVISCLW